MVCETVIPCSFSAFSVVAPHAMIVPCGAGLQERNEATFDGLVNTEISHGSIGVHLDMVR